VLPEISNSSKRNLDEFQKCYMLEINFEDIYTLYFTQFCRDEYIKKDEELGNISGYMGK
jgi:hypothetical protein